MPYATINGVELYYEERGSGAPILFHHGYTGSHDSFLGPIAQLEDRYRCIVMDCRGAGDSAHPVEGHSIEQYAADVVAMADHLGLERFTYAGHSMGGVIGMQLGIEHGERLERLILIAPAPSEGIEETEFMRQMRERNNHLRQARDRETFIRERTMTTARPNPEAIARGVDRMLSVSEQHYEDSWAALKAARLSERLGEIETPTLVIAGAADGLLAANLADFQRLPNATLHVFSRVSHGIPNEVPREFAEVVADFMEHGVVTAGTLQAKLLEEITSTSGTVAR